MIENSYKYDLYGICNHSGGVAGGHYTSFVKMQIINGIILMILIVMK